jgi:hypothetical protein
MRIARLDAALFDHATLGSLNPHPLLLLLGAVELNRGRQMVFSRDVLAELGPVGVGAVWERKPNLGDEVESVRYEFQTSYNIRGLPIAEAVAASSAYPPFFPPVVIRRRRGPRRRVGTFIDGGVIDNAALLAPIDMMIHVSPDRGGRYDPELDDDGRRMGYLSLGESISDLLVANAGAPASTRLQRHWPVWRLLLRVIDIMGGHQEVGVVQKLWLMRRQTRPRITAVTLDAGYYSDQGPFDDRIAGALTRIRTHFDSFDPIEVATLVYSGYYQTDQGFRRTATKQLSCSNFEEIANAVTGAEIVGRMSGDEIIRHLAFSDSRFLVARRIGRAVAKVADRLLNHIDSARAA